jgi:hypothetical protein
MTKIELHISMASSRGEILLDELRAPGLAQVKPAKQEGLAVIEFRIAATMKNAEKILAGLESGRLDLTIEGVKGLHEP